MGMYVGLREGLKVGFDVVGLNKVGTREGARVGARVGSGVGAPAA